ncbi:tyrosine-type recombinase/integrase [Malikia granosa]|uniref:Integrase n=1 Tax=Malikia granosa TaxID=263067 RepID=A0A2S9K059_9BURK|nr:tyrosine-type recombinase/integrase [Malikia granosa]PRD63831.1 integrase [Malikia granosa]
MATSPYGTPPASLYRRRLGPHHFAYLRAVAEGLERTDCARRYLGIEHGHEAVTAHRLVVDQVRAAARRRGETSARLIGLTIRVSGTAQPSLEDFIAERGLDGWSEAEVTELYAECCGEVQGPDPKAQRRERLRRRQIELLRSLESAVAEAPSPSDFVGGWFDEALARKLDLAGIRTLGELNSRVSAGGAWYRPLPAVGKAKAQRIEAFLRTLLPREAQVLPFFGVSRQTGRALVVSGPPSPVPAGSLLGELTIEQTVEAWIAARANSDATRKVYAREVGRFLVWLRHERPGVTPAQLGVRDAVAFAELLRDIPPHFISRRKASPGAIGWAPFRGQLTPASRQQALTVVSSWLDWLVEARHVEANPFRLVSRKQGDDQTATGEVKAITEGAMQALLHYFEQVEPSPAIHRMRFVLRFLESMGLRASELLAARLGDLVTLPEGLALKVHGKGAKNRHVTLNRQAREALNEYLAARGLGDFLQAPAETPILASARDPMTPITYPALYQTVRRWLEKAVSASALPQHEKSQLYKASTHWLRHTFGTRLIEKGAAPDAVQSSMGHASPVTLGRYTRSSAKRQFSEVAKVFGE